MQTPPSFRPLFCVLAGSCGLWLGFPNALGHWPLCALLYPAALCWLGRHARTRPEALRLGWLTGLIGASLALYWLALPVQEVGGLPMWLAAPCAMAIGAYVGLYGGVFALVAHLWRAVPLWLGIPALGAAWYLLEIARGTLLTGFPWLTLAAAFAPWPAFTQAASVLGAYALGGVFAALACLVAVMPRTKTAGVLALAGFLAIGGYGWCRLNNAPPLEHQTGTSVTTPAGASPVILVEGNIDQNQKWEPALQAATVQTYTGLTRAALAARTEAPAAVSPHPLVVWPETAMPFYLTVHPVFSKELRNFVDETDTPLLVGAPGVERPTPRSLEIFNRAYLLTPSAAGARVGAWYDKMHLVPFGEYLPLWLAFDFLKPLLQGVGDFTPGRTAAPLRYEALALGLLICYEGVFPEIAAERVQHGANVLVNISNDGWFGKSAAPLQHLHLSIMRAVEQERWLVRGTNTGISAIIDSYGRVALQGGQHKAQALHGYFWTNENRSVYLGVRTYLPWAAVMLLLPAMTCALRRNRIK